MTGIERLHEIMTRLRDPERGCPWDREQTLESLKPCVLEETHELLAAMDRPDDKANYVEELGDVLLQVMFQSVMAEQEGRFTFDDVANAISDKLVHRHPHVFGSVDAKDSATVLRNWEQIKQMEHRKESRHSALDGVPAALPGLLKARPRQGGARRPRVRRVQPRAAPRRGRRKRRRADDFQVFTPLPRRRAGREGKRARASGHDSRGNGRALGRGKEKRGVR